MSMLKNIVDKSAFLSGFGTPLLPGKADKYFRFIKATVHAEYH